MSAEGKTIAVIGGGHNGLTAAALLAQAGASVHVFEARDLLGGTAAAEEFHPGFTTGGTLHDDALISKQVADRLGLARHGLSFRDRSLPRWIAGPNAGIVISDDTAATAADIARVSPADSRSYVEYRRFVDAVSPALARLLNRPPPDVLNGRGLRTMAEVVTAALTVRRLGSADMMELLRAMPMSVRDFVDDFFENEVLKAGLEGPALLGTWGGPWSPATTAGLLLREAVRGPGVVGGSAALATALESACRAAGVNIHLETEVTAIVLDGERAAGVVVEDGTEVTADMVVSALDPKTTILELLRPWQVPLRFERQVSRYRTRGVVATLALALDRPVEWADRPGEAFGRVQVGSSHAALERAFDAAKYRGGTSAPWLDVHIPTFERPELAPGGGQVVHILATGYAHSDDDDSYEERADAAYDAIVGALSAVAFDVHEAIVGYELRLPEDLQDVFGLAGGHLWHGESALDQLLSFRPSPECASGATPIDGLYLAGGGIHPGGGIRLVAGALAADAVLAK